MNAAARANPYLIAGPAAWSVSGGRTSGFMLYEGLQANGGTLPEDHVVQFANTGKEREETLRFVHEIETHWGVPIVWLEWRPNTPWPAEPSAQVLKRVAAIDARIERARARRRKIGPLKEERADLLRLDQERRESVREWWEANWNPDGFAVVTFETASRNGEPFACLIAKKSYTPNAVTRFCTSELKVRVMKMHAQKVLGWKYWVNVIGLRHDEGHRLLKGYARNADNKEPFKAAFPMDKAKRTEADVLAFWRASNFDLGLRSYEGNCDLCFLKSRLRKMQCIRDNPASADWWVEQERVGKGTFVTEYGVAELLRSVEAQPFLPMFDEPAGDDEHDVECGLLCGVD